MTRTQIITRLESLGFCWLDDENGITVGKDGWEKTYDWSGVSTERIVDDYMTFEWDRYLQVSP